MSVGSLLSWEGLFEMAKRYYNEELPLYMSEHHLRLLCDALNIVLNKQTYKVVITTTILYEHIQLSGDIIYVSTPLISDTINKSTKYVMNNIEIINNDIDIFSLMKTRIGNFKKDQYHDNSALRDRNFLIRFDHVVKILIMISHFYEHIIHKELTFKKHDNFTGITFAQRKTSLNASIVDIAAEQQQTISW